MLDEPTPKKAIEFAIKTEELGNIFYTRMAKKFNEDKEISEIFSLLAKDEVAHQKQFEQLLEKVPDDLGVSSRREDRLAFLKVMSRSEFFMGTDGLYAKLDEIKTTQDALEKAFRLEKDTLGYYQAMKDVIGESIILDAIIEAEKSHIVKVIEYMITGSKMRGLDDDYSGGSPE